MCSCEFSSERTAQKLCLQCGAVVQLGPGDVDLVLVVLVDFSHDERVEKNTCSSCVSRVCFIAHADER